MRTDNRLRIAVMPGDGIGVEVMDVAAEAPDDHRWVLPGKHQDPLPR